MLPLLPMLTFVPRADVEPALQRGGVASAPAKIVACDGGSP